MNLDTLELQIVDNAAAASKTLDSLAASLSNLKPATAGGAGLGKIARQLDSLSVSFAGIQNLNIPTEKISQLTSALQPLTTLGKSSFNSMITGLSKIGQVTKTLETIDMGKFASQIQRVAAAMKPLADEAAKVYVGLKWLPSVVNRVIGANGKLYASNNAAAKSYNALGLGISAVTAKFGIMVLVARRMGNIVGSWIEKANMYVENLNLFNVSMGKYAQEALDYAQKINKSMGVDMSEWIRNQGIIMDMAKSFGVAEGTAYKMSKTLTQLAYDYSSLYNIKVVESMQKVQSAIAGEIEPVRRLGKDISVAKLQTELLALGFDMSVESMTQAEKSMLRTISLLKQSTSAMGDYARTLESPANQMRVFNARVGEMVRALGNMFIPAISAVLPYITAFVQLLTEAANAVARLFGFELPDFDYSGMESVGSAIGGVEDNIEGATSAAKKLKGMLAGFDELNIIQQEQAGAGTGGTDVGSLDLSNKLAEELDRLTKLYDEKFGDAIKQKTDKIVEDFKNKFNKIKDAIEPFMPAIKGVGAALATAFALKWLAKALAGFKKLKAATAILLALKKAAATAFAVFTISGGGFSGFIKGVAAGLSSLWVYFKAFMQGLSPLAKFAVALVGLVATFVTVYDAVKKLTLGSLSFGDAMKNIIPVVGLVGTALYAMLGPWGLVLTGVTAAVAAIAAYSKAQDELRQQMVEATFFDGQGVAIGDLADQYSRAAEAIASTYDPIIQLKDTLDSARSSVDGTTQSLSGIVFGIENGLYSAQESLPKIEEQFSAFRDNMQTILDGTYDVIVHALSGSVGDAIVSAGESLSEYTGLILSAKGNLDEQMLQLTQQFEKLQDDFKSGKITQDDYSDSLSNIVKSMQGLSLSEVAEEVSNLSTKMGTLIDIDFGADTAFADLQKALDGFVASSDTSKEKITTAYAEIKASIEQLKLGATTEEERLSFDKLLGFTDESLKTDLAKIDALAAQFAGQMQGNIVSEVQKQYDAAMENWNSLDWFTQTFKYGGSQAAYVESALRDYNENIVGPMTKKMKESFGGALSDDNYWAQDSINKMMGQLFKTVTTVSASGNWATYSTEFAGNVKTSIDGALTAAGFDASGKFVVEGFSRGVTENAKIANDAMKNLIGTAGGGQKDNGIIGEAQRLLDENSPSKVFEGIGLNLDAGFGKGISENTQLVTAPLQALLDTMLFSVKSFVSDAISEFDELIRSIKDTMQEISSLKSSKTSFGESRFSVSGRSENGLSRSTFALPIENGIQEMVSAVGSRSMPIQRNTETSKSIADDMSKANEPVVAAIHAMANAMVNAYVNNQPIVAIGEKEIARVSQAGSSRLGQLATAP